MATTKQLCAICPRPGSPSSCCQQIHYCSPACRGFDASSHYTMCRSFRTLNARPSPNMRRAILFPENHADPKFIWIPLDSNFPNDEVFDNREIRRLLGGDSSAASVEFDTNPILSRELRYPLHLRFRDGFLQDGCSGINQCIRSITSETTAYWRGPVVAYGLEAIESEQEITKLTCIDLDTTDYKTVVDYFLERHDKTKTVAAVKIHHPGFLQRFAAPQFDDAMVPSMTKSSQLLRDLKLYESDITSLLGMPTYAFAVPTALESIRPDPLDSHNPAAALLHMTFDISNQDWKTWGAVSKFASPLTANVIMLRKDGKPLSPLYLEKMHDWCSKVLQPLFKQARMECEEVVDKTTDAGEVSRKIVEIRDRVASEITAEKAYRYSRSG